MLLVAVSALCFGTVGCVKEEHWAHKTSVSLIPKRSRPEQSGRKSRGPALSNPVHLENGTKTVVTKQGLDISDRDGDKTTTDGVVMGMIITSNGWRWIKNKLEGTNVCPMQVFRLQMMLAWVSNNWVFRQQ